MKLNSNCDENLKTQVVMYLKNSNCDETQKTQIMMRLNNSNCDETQKLKLWWNWKTKKILKQKSKIVMKLM